MFKQALTTIALAMFFFILCSMSKCKEDLTPGPQTTIHGKVTDVLTGQGVPNISFQVWKEYSNPGNIDGGGTGVSLYDTVSTRADGTYTLAFTPKGTGDFTLKYRDMRHNFAASSPTTSIRIGADNTFDFTVYKCILLNVNVHNTTDHARKSFVFSYVSNTPCYDSGYLMNFSTDKSLSFYVPHLSKVTLISNFNNGYSPTKYNTLSDTLVFRQSLNTGLKDTMVNITNP